MIPDIWGFCETLPELDNGSSLFFSVDYVLVRASKASVNIEQFLFEFAFINLSTFLVDCRV